MTTNNWRRLLTAVSWLTVLGLAFSSSLSGNLDALRVSSERFGLRLATSLGQAQPGNNVAVSPLLVQSALALLSAGLAPDSAVAQQLRVALDLQHLGTSEQMLQHFEQAIAQLKQMAATSTDCNMKLLSEFYTKKRYTFNYRDEFEARAAALGIGVNRLNFDSMASVAHDINAQFITHSNFSVGELVSSRMLDATTGSDTPFLHVSSLTFQAPWAQRFDPQQTQRFNFFSNMYVHKLVDAMFLEHSFRYAEVPTLDACLIELPFATADHTLLIVFPNRVDGLFELETQLQNHNLHQLRQQLTERKMALTLPKFRLKAQSELRNILQQLGLGKLFTSELRLQNVFSSFLASSAPHLTAVPHAASLEVQEKGGEVDRTFGAAFTDLFRSTLSVVINHPFFYALSNGKTLLLAGHVVDV